MAQCIRCGRTISGFTFGKKICVWCKQHEAAQRGEEISYQPVMANPWQRRNAMPMLVTQTLFGINVAVFVGMLLSGISPWSPSVASLMSWGANFAPYTLTGQWWRLLTSCFVHAGILHLGFNMWCLWSLGELAERLYGRITFACVYLLCGLAGSIASVFWHNPPVPSIGASGAIFGIAGAVIASVKLGEFSSPVFAQGLMRSLLLFVAYNVVFGAIVGTTDNACHLGGLAAGLLIGALIAKVSPEPRFAPRAAIFILIAALLGGGVYAMQRSRAYPYYLARAQEQIDDGKIDAAIPLAESAIRLHPQMNGTVHYQLALAYWDKKDLPKAEGEMQKALTADPKNLDYLYGLGALRLQAHKLPEARESFAQLAAADPKSAEAHAGLAEVAQANGDYDTALNEYAQAAELNPQLGGVREAIEKIKAEKAKAAK